MEADIYPLAIYLGEKGTTFNRKFFYETPNRLRQLVDVGPGLEDCLRVIDVGDFYPGCHLDLVMDDERGQAIAFCVPDPAATGQDVQAAEPEP
jgi:hypothetical protein